MSVFDKYIQISDKIDFFYTSGYLYLPFQLCSAGPIKGYSVHIILQLNTHIFELLYIKIIGAGLEGFVLLFLYGSK